MLNSVAFGHEVLVRLDRSQSEVDADLIDEFRTNKPVVEPHDAAVCAVQPNLLAALARPDAKVRDQESEATRHTGARPDRDAATMRYFLHWPCRTLSWPRPYAILLTLSTGSLH